MTKTFLTQSEHVQTTFEKKYLEMMGDHQERRIDLPGLSPQLIAKNQELENIRAELAQAVKDQEVWDAELEESKSRLNEQRLKFEQVEVQNQEILKRLKTEISKYSSGAKVQLQLTRQYEQEYEQLIEKEQELQRNIADYKKEIAVLQPYADFFEDIVNNGNMFGTTENILNRYKALTIAKDDCATNLQQLISGFKEPNSDLKEELEVLKGHKIELSHNVARIKEEISKLSKQNRYVQMNSIKDVERVTDKECEYVTIMSSIKNIAKRVMSTEEKLGAIYTPATNRNTTEGKLAMIEVRYQELLAIIEPKSLNEINKNKKQRPKTTQNKRVSSFKPTPFEKGSETSRKPATETVKNSQLTSKRESNATSAKDSNTASKKDVNSPSTSRRLSTKNSIQTIPFFNP